MLPKVAKVWVRGDNGYIRAIAHLAQGEPMDRNAFIAAIIAAYENETVSEYPDFGAINYANTYGGGN